MLVGLAALGLTVGPATLNVGAAGAVTVGRGAPAVGPAIRTPEFSASLTGATVVPPVTSRATGTTDFKVVLNYRALRYSVQVGGIRGATAVRVHLGAAGANGPVVATLMALPSPGATGSVTLAGYLTAAGLSGPMAGKTVRTLINAMSADDTYLDVSTVAHPKGELRGQLHDAT